MPDGLNFRILGQAPPRKIFRFYRSANQSYGPPRPAPVRGAYRDRHGRGVRDAMDALGSSRRARPEADGKAVWSRHPDAGVESCGRQSRETTEANKPGLRGERGAAVKTIAQGKPALLRFTCGPTPVLFVARGPRVQSAPGFPCALSHRGQKLGSNSGAIRAAGTLIFAIRCLKCWSAQCSHRRHTPEGPSALFAGRVLSFDERAGLIWARLMAEGTGKAEGRSRHHHRRDRGGQ